MTARDRQLFLMLDLMFRVTH